MSSSDRHCTRRWSDKVLPFSLRDDEKMCIHCHVKMNSVEQEATLMVIPAWKNSRLTKKCYHSIEIPGFGDKTPQKSNRNLHVHCTVPEKVTFKKK